MINYEDPNFIREMKRRQNEYKESQLKLIEEKIRVLKSDILFLEDQASEIKGEKNTCNCANRINCKMINK